MLEDAEEVRLKINGLREGVNVNDGDLEMLTEVFVRVPRVVVTVTVSLSVV
jgi:hypothetical protein